MSWAPLSGRRADPIATEDIEATRHELRSVLGAARRSAQWPTRISPVCSGPAPALLAVLLLTAVAVACAQNGEISISTTTEPPADATTITTTEPPAGATTITATDPPAETASTANAASSQTSPPEPSTPDSLQMLAADGLGAIRFGEPADTALPLLIDLLGHQPTDDTGAMKAIAHGFGGTTVRFVTLGPVIITFSDGSYHRNDQVMHFAGWGLSGPASSALTTPQGITLGSTVDELRMAFGDQLRLSPELDECTGTWVFRVGPTVLGFEGDLSGPTAEGSSFVTRLAAGAQSTC